MAIKHNQKLVKNHFRKDWKRRVRCHFDQPGKNQAAGQPAKPRPLPLRQAVDKLRPIVRCPTIKYNRKLRTGRGFSLTELKEVGIARLYAPTIGIAVDRRRRNLSEESLAINVARLREYMKRIIILPRKSNKAKEGQLSYADIEKTETVRHVAALMPIPATDRTILEISKSDMPKPIEGGAYIRLRQARGSARYAGKQSKRARDKADVEAAKK